MKTETRLALGAQTFPVGPHRLQQLKGAAHIALGRQVQHQVGIGLLHRRCCSRRIGEVHPQELVACLRLGQRLDAGSANRLQPSPDSPLGWSACPIRPSPPSGPGVNSVQVAGRNSRNPAAGWEQNRSIVSACCSNRIAVAALRALPMARHTTLGGHPRVTLRSRKPSSLVTRTRPSWRAHQAHMGRARKPF
jgi:hypothetical protein